MPDKKLDIKIKGLVDSYLNAVDILIANSKHYESIHLMVSIMELIGGLYDNIDLNVDGYSQQRFDYVLNNLLIRSNAKYSTAKKSPGERLFKGLRCSFSHILKPSNFVSITTRSEAAGQANVHLCNEKTQPKYIVIVAEDFLDDIKSAWLFAQTDPKKIKRTDKDFIKVW